MVLVKKNNNSRPSSTHRYPVAWPELAILVKAFPFIVSRSLNRIKPLIRFQVGAGEFNSHIKKYMCVPEISFPS